jgi:putative phosphoribosyl transferase
MPFKDRSDAGRRLAAALKAYRRQKPVVLALPRGGVPVAAEVCAALDAPLDLIIARKIGVPIQPELAMGAIAEGGEPAIVRNEEIIALVGITEAEFKAVCDRERREIERRRRRYLGDRAPVEVAGRTAIVIDDGIATGATMRAALLAVRARKPKQVVMAVPVAPTSTLDALRRDADDIVCLEDHEPFGAIGMFYRDFRQVSDEEVVDFLARHRTAAPAS